MCDQKWILPLQIGSDVLYKTVGIRVYCATRTDTSDAQEPTREIRDKRSQTDHQKFGQSCPNKKAANFQILAGNGVAISRAAVTCRQASPAWAVKNCCLEWLLKESRIRDPRPTQNLPRPWSQLQVRWLSTANLGSLQR
jgi:hypothetical protein